MRKNTSDKLVFEYGTGFNQLIFTSKDKLEAETIYNIYITYDGGTKGARSDIMNTYYNRFNLFFVKSNPSSIERIEGTWSHRNYGFTSGLTGEFNIGSLYRGTQSLIESIAALSMTTLLNNKKATVNAPDPIQMSEREIIQFATSPLSWVKQYKVKNSPQ